MKRNLDRRRKLTQHALQVQRYQFCSGVGKIVRQEAAACAETIACVRYVDINFLNLDFQNITGLSFLNGYRSR